MLADVDDKKIITITNSWQRVEMKIDVGSDRVYIIILFGVSIEIMLYVVWQKEFANIDAHYVGIYHWCQS